MAMIDATPKPSPPRQPRPPPSRLKQALATLSADLRRDIYIFVAAIVFLTVVYFLTQLAEPWLN
jgi:hypothetical protein